MKKIITYFFQFFALYAGYVYYPFTYITIFVLHIKLNDTTNNGIYTIKVYVENKRK